VKCVDREWRSDYVKEHFADAGQGIGLWLVHEIMQLHKGGHFEPKATTAGFTEFRLTLPLD
jgi:signal transduction histidine kinase